MIKVTGLSKDYKIVKKPNGLLSVCKSMIHPSYTIIPAVQNLNFEINDGEFVGFIGPNGSGKSTTIKMLSGILKPTEGKIEIDNLDPYKDRKKVVSKLSVVFGQRTQLWWDLPVEESFKLLQRIYSIPKDVYIYNLNQFIEVLKMDELLGKTVRQLSLGQRMRAEIAAALLHDPKILFLDEPTIGLDVSTKYQIWNYIKTIHENRKTTVILTSHDMHDIDKLSDRILMIKQGKITYNGNITDLKREYIKSHNINSENVDIDEMFVELYGDTK